MQRYRLTIEYLGTQYHGWQRQPQKPTIQQTLEEAFKICLRQTITIVGSGRTDTGVHAKGQVAHFDCETSFEPKKIELSVNHLTPPDVFIRGLEPCSLEFHARYHAIYREYQYKIWFRPSAHHYHDSWHCPYSLDPELFLSELKDVEGSHDFLGFSIPRNDGKTTDCIIQKTNLKVNADSFIITIRGNRFLHKMVRSIMGACYDVSRKKHKPGLVKSILNQNCQVERTWAPSKGLCLEKVGYQNYED